MYLLPFITTYLLILPSVESKGPRNCQTTVQTIINRYILQEQTDVKGTPADLAIHWRTGDIFFTLISHDAKMKLHVLHKNGILKPLHVPGLGQSVAVNHKNNTVYLATDNGLYKYLTDDHFEFYAAANEDVMYATLGKDGQEIYIATYPQNRVKKLSEGNIESFPLIPEGHGLTADWQNNMYFIAAKTLYVLQYEHTIPEKIRGIQSDNIVNVAVSISGKVYVMDENSNLFKIQGDFAKFYGSFHVGGVNCFGLDSKENVIIGVSGKILTFRLLGITENPCPNT